MEEYKYYIAGEFKTGDEKINVVNPATEEIFARLSQTSEKDLQAAVTGAKQAAKLWKKTSFKERAAALREIAKCIYDNLNTLATLETREIGKPFKESLFVDIQLGADCFKYYASFLESIQEESLPGEYGIDLIKYEPFGVCGVYLPYNVPLMIFGFTGAAALAAGNSLIIKPSEFASLSLLELVKHLDRLDLPKGLINVVTGRGETIGKALAESPVDLISFTGSRQTLKKIIAATVDNPKKIICELGGCNIAAVFADCDKEAAMQNILGSSFMKQGQMCIGTSLALVDEKIYPEFSRELVRKAGAIKIGDPFAPENGLGPIATKKHRDDIDNKVSELIKTGAVILCGGKPLAGKGYFYPATVIELKNICYEEFFAPVVLLKSFNGRREAEEIIENNPTGLVCQIWTKDLPYAQRLAGEISYGTVWVNSFVQMSSLTPFGGVRASGWGRNLGREGFFEYIQSKHIGIGLLPSPVTGWFGA
jgi:acyl-CoA reductase-like NAD-dependent aldehyde dehydrogenase